MRRLSFGIAPLQPPLNSHPLEQTQRLVLYLNCCGDRKHLSATQSAERSFFVQSVLPSVGGCII